MKKTLALLLVFSLLLSLAACGNSGKQQEEPADEPEQIENIVFEYGRVSGGVYENDIAGFGFRFGECGMEEEAMGAYRGVKPAEELAKNMLGTLVVELHCNNGGYAAGSIEPVIYMIVTVNVQEVSDRVSDFAKDSLDRSLERFGSGNSPFRGYSVSENRLLSGKIGRKDYEGYELSINDSINGTNIVKRAYFTRCGQYIYSIHFDASDSDTHSSFADLSREIDSLISGYFYGL